MFILTTVLMLSNGSRYSFTSETEFERGQRALNTGEEKWGQMGCNCLFDRFTTFISTYLCFFWLFFNQLSWLIRHKKKDTVPSFAHSLLFLWQRAGKKTGKWKRRKDVREIAFSECIFVFPAYLPSVFSGHFFFACIVHFRRKYHFLGKGCVWMEPPWKELQN